MKSMKLFLLSKYYPIILKELPNLQEKRKGLGRKIFLKVFMVERREKIVLRGHILFSLIKIMLK